MGICGGFQMLGKKLYDPHHTESQREEAAGLGLLDIETTFYPEKTTRQVWGQVMGRGLFFDGLRGERVRGYEIHMGKTRLGAGVVPAFKITRDPYGEINIDDGAVKDNGLIFGTYIHGIFDNDLFRRSFINKLRVRRGWDPLEVEAEYCYDKALERDFNMLADTVRANMDIGKIYKIMGLEEKYL
jgi:adenosylcobyric acid synthase